MTDIQNKTCQKNFEEFDKEHNGYILEKDLPSLLKKCCDEKGKECS